MTSDVRQFMEEYGFALVRIHPGEEPGRDQDNWFEKSEGYGARNMLRNEGLSFRVYAAPAGKRRKTVLPYRGKVRQSRSAEFVGEAEGRQISCTQNCEANSPGCANNICRV